MSQRAILGGIWCRGGRDDRQGKQLSFEESLEELMRLAETLGLEPCATVRQEREAPDPATYFGKGKVEEIKALAEQEQAQYLIVDGALTPTQVRNLEESTGLEVLDRTTLILRIFAARAQSREGKIQVELASLRHNLTRLAGLGVTMSNPGGGIGTRGPGEQKIEIERRIIRQRIARLSRELERVRRVRTQQRKLRKESGIPLVSLVGYTNAGKSTLFNLLTGGNALCDDKLFATLDPWTRKWTLSTGQTVLLCDTVGFIQALPHELVAAFRATLEESVEADLLVHVVDLSSSVWKHQMETVNSVLEDLGVCDRPRIVLFNKVDKVNPDEIDLALREFPDAIPISALHGVGIDALEQSVIKWLARGKHRVSWKIPYSSWDLLWEIKRLGNVIEEKHQDDGALVTCELEEHHISRISKRLGYGAT